jgi:hypothetical protein
MLSVIRACSTQLHSSLIIAACIIYIDITMQVVRRVLVQHLRGPRTTSRTYTTLKATHQYSPIVGEQSVRALNDEIIRVDHAGEYGAQRIYDGQIAVLGNDSCGHLLRVCSRYIYRVDPSRSTLSVLTPRRRCVAKSASTTARCASWCASDEHGPRC